MPDRGLKQGGRKESERVKPVGLFTFISCNDRRAGSRERMGQMASPVEEDRSH